MKDVSLKSVPTGLPGVGVPSSFVPPTERIEIIDRNPQPGTATPKFERVLHLFRDTPLNPDASLIALVRSRPIERFIAAVAWWSEGSAGKFRFACQPGIACSAVAGSLIESLETCARQAGMKTLQCATLLVENDDWFGILRSHDFTCLHSERSFEVLWRDAWTRVMQLHGKHHKEIPSGWRTEPIRKHPPETALELIAPHRLMLPDEIRSLWRADTQCGFDRELSCILFDGQRPFGAYLTRRIGDAIYVDVQVACESNRRLRSLASIFLLYHAAQRVDRDGSIRWIRFRSGQAEHRQTQNLALRMGGREVSRCHLMTKTLDA